MQKRWRWGWKPRRGKLWLSSPHTTPSGPGPGGHGHPPHGGGGGGGEGHGGGNKKGKSRGSGLYYGGRSRRGAGIFLYYSPITEEPPISGRVQPQLVSRAGHRRVRKHVSIPRIVIPRGLQSAEPHIPHITARVHHRHIRRHVSNPVLNLPRIQSAEPPTGDRVQPLLISRNRHRFSLLYHRRGQTFWHTFPGVPNIVPVLPLPPTPPTPPVSTLCRIRAVVFERRGA